MKKKYVRMGLIVVLSVILAYLQYIQAVCHSDDAGTYIHMYNYFELGNREINIKTLLNPWFFSSAIVYLLNVGGNGAVISEAYLSVWYGIAVFFTLVLMMHKKDAQWLLALAVFILMPSSGTNRYHMVVTFVTLFAIWAIQCYVESGKKWILLAVVLVSLYTLIFADDRMLLMLFLAAPLIVYYAICLFQDQSKRKYLYVAVFGLILAAGVLKCIDIIAVNLLGQSTGIMDAFGGYGGSEYYTWIDVETLFAKGIPSIFSSLFGQWNIPAKGGMIQINSLYWIVRMALACLALGALCSRWIEIIKKGIRNVELLDSLSVLCTTVVLGANVLNGMVWYYDLANAPMNRYASICWFLLVVILVRWLDERYSNKTVYQNISSNWFLGVVCVLLIIGYMPTKLMSGEDGINTSCTVELNYLKEHGETYKYGLASYWKSHPVTAASNAEYAICPGWITEEGLERRTGDGIYMDGGNYFNFFVSDENNSMTISPENINWLRGDYIDIYANGNAGCIIYMYDYDIRFDSRLIMEAVGTDYELTEPIQYHFDFPLGTNRIEMEVANSANFELSIEDNEDVEKVDVQIINENKIYVDLVCTQNTKVDFNVARKVDELTTIHKIVLKRVKAAVEIDTDEIFLRPGSYIVTFNGSNLHDAQISFEGTDFTAQRLTDGRIKNRYQIDIDKAQTIKYNVTGKNPVVDKVYYENAVLFEEESDNE